MSIQPASGRDPSRTRLAAPALVVLTACLITVATVWSLQHAGFAPCELCFKERLPFYWSVPLSILVAWLALTGRRSLLPAGYVALAIVFLCGAGLGLYHAGVEWHFWPGPTSCTGGYAAPAGVSDFLNDLRKTQVVQCDAPALRVAGLSLAAWNAALCLALVAVAAFGVIRAERGRRPAVPVR